jgi:hypothetical protein
MSPQNILLTKSTTEDNMKCKLLTLNENGVAMERLQGSGKAYDPLSENLYR